MATEPVFYERCVEACVCNWSYQYYCNDFSDHYNTLKDWCAENFEDHRGWLVNENGVSIYNKEDAMMFKLRWTIRKIDEPIYCHVWLNGSDESVELTQDEWVINLNQSLIHRLDGPAVIWVDGTRQWWVDGQPHRLDGPAFEWANGNREWAIYGVDKNTEEIERWIEENNIDLKTEEGQMGLKLTWM